MAMNQIDIENGDVLVRITPTPELRRYVFRITLTRLARSLLIPEPKYPDAIFEMYLEPSDWRALVALGNKALAKLADRGGE